MKKTVNDFFDEDDRAQQRRSVFWSMVGWDNKVRVGKWMTLKDIQRAILKSEGKHYELTSISARVRDLRKKQYGGHNVPRNYIGNRVFGYRLIPNLEKTK